MNTATAHLTTGERRAAQRRSDRRWALLAGACAAVAGVLSVFVHYLGGTEGDPEGWFAAVGFAAPFLGAGLLAILGSALDAPWHWWAAGIALVPCSIVSVVLFPVLLPAATLVVVGFRNGPNGARDLWGGVLSAALSASFAVVVFHQDPVSWPGGSSSNIVTMTEATLSVAVAVCVLVVGWAVAAAPVRH